MNHLALSFRLAASALALVGCGSLLGITELGTDAPADGETDAGASWCSANAGTATFCDDFGDPSLSAGWSIESSGSGGTGTLDRETYTSAPAAFTAEVAPADTIPAQWCLRKTFDVGDAGVRLALDLRVETLEAASAQASLSLATLAFAGVGQEHAYTLDLALRADGLHLLEHLSTGEDADRPLLLLPLAATWMRIELIFERAAEAPPRVSVTVNGEVLLAPQLAGDGNANGAPTVRLGIVAASGYSGIRTAHFDNVVVDQR